jgi:hypothetical protein
MNKPHIIVGLMLVAIATGAMAQKTQATNIKGNTEITVNTKNTTAVAVGENVVAKNRVGVVQGDKRGDTKISVSATNVTNVVAGRNKKACVNIGAIIKNDECK